MRILPALSEKLFCSGAAMQCEEGSQERTFTTEGHSLFTKHDEEARRVNLCERLFGGSSNPSEAAFDGGRASQTHTYSSLEQLIMQTTRYIDRRAFATRRALASQKRHQLCFYECAFCVRERERQTERKKERKSTALNF